MAEFDPAFKELLIWEGEYSNDHRDAGGETKFGISRRSYPNLDLKNLTLEKAKEIYLKDWWVPNHYGEIGSQEIATKLLVLAVNIGAKPANKILQTAMNAILGNGSITVDGVIGKETQKALKWVEIGNHNSWVLDKIKLLSIMHYVSLCVKSKKYRIFLLGWLKRALA